MITRALEGITPPDDSEVGEPFFADPRYKALPLESSRFNKLEPRAGKVACVDGGNQCVLDTPSLAVHLVRVYYNLFNGAKRLKQEKNEFLVEARTRVEGRKVLIDAECKALNGNCIESFSLDAFDASVSLNNRRASPAIAGNVARRYAEWSLTERALREANAVVRDGALETSVTGEAAHAKKCFGTGKLCGIAKTSALLTTTGLPLTVAVQKIAPKGAWQYGPVCVNNHPDHNAEIFVTRFHESSERAFRFEVEKGGDSKSIAEAVAFQSNDACFPGYPYGLIDADAMTRVTNAETKALKELLNLRFKGLRGAVDAHAVLDAL